MKKVITGASVILTGAIVFLAVFVAAGNLGTVSGWGSSGRFWWAVSEANLTHIFVISIILMIAGISVMIWGNLNKSD